LRKNLFRKPSDEYGVTICIKQRHDRKGEKFSYLGGNSMEFQFLLMKRRLRKRSCYKMQCFIFSGKLKEAFTVEVVMEHMRIQHRHRLSRGDFKIPGADLVKSYLKKTKVVPPLLQGSRKESAERDVSLPGFIRHKKSVDFHFLPPPNTFKSF